MPCRVHVRPAISYELPEMPSRRFELHRDGGKTPVPVVWDSAFSCGFGLPGALPEHAAVAVSWLNKLDADGRAATAAQNRIHEEFNEAARVRPEGALALKKRVTELEQQLGALQTQFDLKAKECETLRALADKRAQDLADGLFDEDGNPVESANELEALRAELEKGKGLAEKFEQLKRVHAAFVEAQGNLSRQAKGGGNSCSGSAGFDAVAAVGARLKKQLGDIFTTEPGGVPQSYRRGTIEELAELLGLGQAAGNPDKDAQAKTDTAHMELLQRIGARVSGLYEDAPVEENPAQRGVAANDAARAACDFAVAELNAARTLVDDIVHDCGIDGMRATEAFVIGEVSGIYIAAFKLATQNIEWHREQFIEPPKPKPPGS